MKKQWLIFTMILGLVVSMASCSDDSPEIPVSEKQVVIEEGMELYSQMFANGTLIEESVDVVTNFGTELQPALFYVNKHHKAGGVDIAPGVADLDCSFISLTKEEYISFIKLYAIFYGITHSTNLTAEQQAEAFIKFREYALDNDIEIALMIYLVNGNDAELKALTEIIDETSEVETSVNNINSIMTSMIRNKVTPSSLKTAVMNEGVTIGEFMRMAEEKGISISEQINSRNTATKVVKAIVKGLVIASKVIIALIENTTPVVDLENIYGCYLHEDDLDPLNYISPTYFRSDSYEFRYGTKSAPMAQAIFSIETYYGSKRENDGGRYIPRVGMLVEKVRCTGGMHVEGEVAFEPAVTRYDEAGNLIAVANGEVTIYYGDCCCFAKTGKVNFTVDAINGYRRN